MIRALLATLALTFMFATLGSGMACFPDGEVGDACVVTGDGFTRKDPCVDFCINWEITCPSGATLVPDSCSGPVCGLSGSCPSGQVCLQVDSFAQNSRCMDAAVCGGGGGGGGGGAALEAPAEGTSAPSGGSTVAQP